MTSFDDLQMIEPLRRAVSEENYETPTEIQARAIPGALDDRDILGSARTGTGKTAAFALPILNRLGKRTRKSVPHKPRALILAPTRELAVQIGDSFATYGRHLRLKRVLVYGGVSQIHQVRVLKRGAHIVIATPGRLLDLMSQGHVKLDELEVFVLDEADRMLDMGFLPDLKRIIESLPEKRQSMFFSATLPPKIVDLSKELLRNPIEVHIAPETTTIEQIEQSVVYLPEAKRKRQHLEELLRADDVRRTLIFTRTKRGAGHLAENLNRSGIRAVAIHGDKTQSARQRALNDFRRDKVRVLVATDVAARGIDVDGITHVVNYDLPLEVENYVHRIGRTGRAGASGVAISLCGPSEKGLLRAIEGQIGRKIPCVDEQGKPLEMTFRKKPGGKGPGAKRKRSWPKRNISADSEAPKRRRRPRKRPAAAKS